MKFNANLQVVDAIQWTGNNHRSIEEFTSGSVFLTSTDPIVMPGGQTLNVTDWIIRLSGYYEFVCLPDRIFQIMYSATS